PEEPGAEAEAERVHLYVKEPRYPIMPQLVDHDHDPDEDEIPPDVLKNCHSRYLTLSYAPATLAGCKFCALFSIWRFPAIFRTATRATPRAIRSTSSNSETDAGSVIAMV